MKNHNMPLHPVSATPFLTDETPPTLIGHKIRPSINALQTEGNGEQTRTRHPSHYTNLMTTVTAMSLHSLFALPLLRSMQ